MTTVVNSHSFIGTSFHKFTVCQGLATGQWFSPGTLVSSTNKTDRHDTTEILLKVVLNNININPKPNHKFIGSWNLWIHERCVLCFQNWNIDINIIQVLHLNLLSIYDKVSLLQLMRRYCSSVLTQSLVALHDKGTVSLDLAIQLLQVHYY